MTGPAYQPIEHVPWLQVIDDVGAVVSIWTSCEFTASALPALSKARYLTVAVAETVKGAV